MLIYEILYPVPRRLQAHPARGGSLRITITGQDGHGSCQNCGHNRSYIATGKTGRATQGCNRPPEHYSAPSAVWDAPEKSKILVQHRTIWHDATGYVFRAENQATVGYLQGIGEPGHLVTVEVNKERKRSWIISLLQEIVHTSAVLASFLYAAGVVLIILALAILEAIRDFWGVGALGLLIFSRS
jgi:hypothetical protein